MSQSEAAVQLTAVNSACHCGLAEWLLLVLTLVVCTCVLAWRHRTRGIGSRWPALRFALLWVGGMLVVAVRIGSHDLSSAQRAPVPRTGLAAQAGSICASTYASQSSGDVAEIVKGTDQATQALRRLHTPATATLEWRRFVAGAVAADRELADAGDDVAVTSAIRAKRQRAETKGDAAARRLGIDCPQL